MINNKTLEKKITFISILQVIKLIAKPTPEQNGQNDQTEEEGDAWQVCKS